MGGPSGSGPMKGRRMRADPDLDGVSSAARRPGGFGRKLWRLASTYYSSEEWRSAWAITAAVVVLTVVQIGLQVRLNICNRDFFDALERRDHAGFLWQMGLFTALALSGI